MRYTQMGVPQVIRATLAAFLLSCPLARADVIADWNAVALNAVTSSEQHPAYAARAMATVHVAMFEVMNFIEGAYVPRFLVKPPAPLGTSSEAAAAGAAHYVLGELYPSQKAALDAALERSLAAMPDEQEKSSARIWGRHLGANIYAIRSSGESDISRPIKSPRMSRVHASIPESLATVVALNTIIARFIEAKRLKPIDGARLHALASIAVSDVYVAGRDAKFTLDSDYPCAPCAVGAAAVVILESEFGSASVPGAAIPSSGASGAARKGAYVRGDADELSSGFLYNGVHYLDSIKAGEEIGRKIGMHALTSYRSIK
jgi:hypothetical protein